MNEPVLGCVLIALFILLVFVYERRLVAAELLVQRLLGDDFDEHADQALEVVHGP